MAARFQSDWPLGNEEEVVDQDTFLADRPSRGPYEDESDSKESAAASQPRFLRFAAPGGEIDVHLLVIVEAGVVSVSEWRPESPGPRPTLAEVSCYGGVGRKP